MEVWSFFLSMTAVTSLSVLCAELCLTLVLYHWYWVAMKMIYCVAAILYFNIKKSTVFLILWKDKTRLLVAFAFIIIFCHCFVLALFWGKSNSKIARLHKTTTFLYCNGGCWRSCSCPYFPAFIFYPFYNYNITSMAQWTWDHLIYWL